MHISGTSKQQQSESDSLTSLLSRRLLNLIFNMSKHRVDVDLKGMSHYIDGEFQGASGFPLWDKQLPEGLHLERRVGHQAGKKKFVRKKGLGRSVEWTSNRV